jgi:hypothetical protein
MSHRYGDFISSANIIKFLVEKIDVSQFVEGKCILFKNNL